MNMALDRGELFNLLSEIAECYGTPVYVYFEEELVKCLKRFKEIFYSHFKDGLIAYAYKANSNPTICKVILDHGIGVEAVSGNEVLLALKLGVPTNMIVFDGVSKSREELELAIENRVLVVNVESLIELSELSKIASKLNAIVNVGLRLNVGVEVATYKKVMTASPQDKFGIDYRKSVEAVRLALSLPNLKLVGLHMHIGSQISKLRDFIKGLKRVLEVAREIRFRLGYDVNIIDVGGGYPYPYDGSFDEWLFIDKLFEAMGRELKEYTNETRSESLSIISEPGRILVASSGVLLTCVNYVKESYRTKWVLVDAGMNDLMRPALYGVEHRVSLVSGGREASEVYNIAGPICESTDVLACNVKLPKVREGDLLAIWDVGAYGYSMSNNYNMRLRPAEVLVTREHEVKLIRQREVFEDLIKGTEINK